MQTEYGTMCCWATRARKLVERLCDIEIVDSDTGFGFL
jgi:hypothetical protein